MASVALVAAGLLAGAIGGSLLKNSQEKGGAQDVELPTRERPEVDAARRRQKALAAQQRGRQSTILSGAGGGPNELVSQRTTLLGGVQ